MLLLILSEQTRRTCVDQSVIERSIFFFSRFRKDGDDPNSGCSLSAGPHTALKTALLDFGLLTLPKDVASCPSLGLLAQRRPSPAALGLSGSFCSPPPAPGLLRPCLHLLCCVVPASVGHPHRVERESSQSFLCPQC